MKRNVNMPPIVRGQTLLALVAMGVVKEGSCHGE